MGITCALCHSTVDDSFSAGIGQRLDGWPNGRFATLGSVVDHYNSALGLKLSDAQKGDLVEYLKSL